MTNKIMGFFSQEKRNNYHNFVFIFNNWSMIVYLLHSLYLHSRSKSVVTVTVTVTRCYHSCCLIIVTH